MRAAADRRELAIATLDQLRRLQNDIALELADRDRPGLADRIAWRVRKIREALHELDADRALVSLRDLRDDWEALRAPGRRPKALLRSISDRVAEIRAALGCEANPLW